MYLTSTFRMASPHLNFPTTLTVRSAGSFASIYPLTIFPENAYSAAQRFLAQQDLPMSYLDQVVRFIEQNSSGVSLGGGNDFVDPFTGESDVHSI